jgi:hypothetical protein
MKALRSRTFVLLLIGAVVLWGLVYPGFKKVSELRLENARICRDREQDATFLKGRSKDEVTRSYWDRQVRYWHALRLEYERAARNPWVSIGPVPPWPH